MGKGKKKSGKSKSKKSQATDGQTEAPPQTAPGEQTSEQPKEQPASGTKEDAPATGSGGGGGAQDPNAKQRNHLSDEEKARKIEKNKQAIENIISMLRSIPPDNISKDTREDLIKIHELAKGITKRYPPKEGAKEGGGGGGGSAPGGEKKQEEATGAAGGGQQQTEFKLDAVKPAFADIFSVCEPGES